MRRATRRVNNPPQAMSPAAIRFALAEKGLTYAELDARHDLPEGTCRNAARKPHARGEAAIAAALGQEPAFVWPARYGPDGRRLSPQPPKNYRPARQYGHCQNGRES